MLQIMDIKEIMTKHIPTGPLLFWPTRKVAPGASYCQVLSIVEEDRNLRDQTKKISAHLPSNSVIRDHL